MTITYALIQTCELLQCPHEHHLRSLPDVPESTLRADREGGVSGTMEKTAQMSSTAPMVVTGMVMMARMMKMEQTETKVSTALMARKAHDTFFRRGREPGPACAESYGWLTPMEAHQREG